jgi:predicted TIM-barrel fold metal-dependent hydrolase
MKSLAAVVLVLTSSCPHAQEMPPPIIDMHLHASRIADFALLAGAPPIPHCVPMTNDPIPESGRRVPETFRSRHLPCHATWSPMADDEVMESTLEIMERRNIFGVVSGTHIARWFKAEPERVIPGLSFAGGPDAPTVDSVRKWFKEGQFVVFGEVTAQYGGMAPDDPSLAPYWALADELDVPVGIHIGTGPLGAPYLGFDRYRARLHSALGLEEVLLRHPNLRVYIMHAGWPMIDDLLAVLWTHPQVYVDVGAIDWALPRAEFHRYLQRIVEAGFGKRVLFGSDQMIWPETLEMAIESIESAGFLTAEQRRDIFFNNAARFLRLSPAQIATMQGKQP